VGIMDVQLQLGRGHTTLPVLRLPEQPAWELVRSVNPLEDTRAWVCWVPDLLLAVLDGTCTFMSGDDGGGVCTVQTNSKHRTIGPCGGSVV
jgi:hypothetical protein